MSTSRLESFSDGVLAVAITLLVLDIHVPEAGSQNSLAHQLGQQWPSYAAYVVSFITIGIIWINHNAMLSRLRQADHTLLMLNLLLLLSVGVLPFVTSLFARYLREGHGQHLAAAVFGGAFLVMGIMFALMQRHMLLVRPGLLGVELDKPARSRIVWRNVAGVIPYVFATALAPVSAYATLIICSAVAAFYALPFVTTP